MPDESQTSEERPASSPPKTAEAVVRQRSRVSAVWLIPLVAVLIGAFLVYKTFSERGPTVKIHFKTAAGLEAGKTQVKYKDLQMGLVTDIALADDISHVIVTVDFAKEAEDYLTENTRFWVVKAQVSAGRVTGLGTIFSGAYIGIDPSTEGRPVREFTGLEVQPVVTSDDPGTQFVLRSPTGGSFDVGAPVYYHRIHVGEVVSYELDESGDFVTVRIFVHTPHDTRVKTHTRFWNASGLDVELDAGGIRVNTDSLTSLLIGGVAFDNPDNLETGEEPPEGHVFPLHSSRHEALIQSYTIRRPYLLHFHESVDNLTPGAPVLFQGIQVGRVLDVRLELNPKTLVFRIPVLIQIEPERVTSREEITADPETRMKRLIEKGLRARLKTGALLTGKKEIELVMVEVTEPTPVVADGKYIEIPTIPAPLGALAANLGDIVKRLDQVPLEEIGDNLNRSLARLAATLENTERLTGQIEAELLPNVNAAAADASALLSPTSPVNAELRQLLVELTEAARSIRLMADYLERHPEALIRGKEGDR
jgi:paraquat-inducible protein B